MDLGIRGKYALVTGGSHGIGLAIAQGLAAEGCNVAICARNKNWSIADAQTQISLAGNGINTIGIKADATNHKDIIKAMQKINRVWGKLHILVNNVGGGGRWGSDLFGTSEQVWEYVYDKNAKAALRFTVLALPLMLKQKWGRVITIASVFGKESGGKPWFNVAKSAEISLMKSLSLNKQLVRSGITFNTVAPGAIMVPGTGWDEDSKKPNFKDFLEQLPLNRLGTPEEVANMVVFLCSEKASLVNGACIVVDGGESRSF